MSNSESDPKEDDLKKNLYPNKPANYDPWVIPNRNRSKIKARAATPSPSNRKVTASSKESTARVVSLLRGGKAVADEHLNLTIEIDENVSTEEVAKELATLCKALNAYHIACGGNGFEIADWETLIAVRESVGV